MSLDWAKNLQSVIWGPMLAAPQTDACQSLYFRAVLCDLRPRFIPKCRVGRGYRAVARNGRVLLASNLPMDLLIEREAHIRLQPWRKVILPGERPKTYGVLMCARCLDPSCSGLEAKALYHSCLVSEPPTTADLALDIGGGMVMVFFRSARSR